MNSKKKRKKKERRNASDSIFFLRALFPKISPLGEESRRAVRPSLRRIFDAPSRHRSCEIPRGGKGTSAKGSVSTIEGWILDHDTRRAV